MPFRKAKGTTSLLGGKALHRTEGNPPMHPSFRSLDARAAGPGEERPIITATGDFNTCSSTSEMSILKHGNDDVQGSALPPIPHNALNSNARINSDGEEISKGERPEAVGGIAACSVTSVKSGKPTTSENEMSAKSVAMRIGDHGTEIISRKKLFHAKPSGSAHPSRVAPVGHEAKSNLETKMSSVDVDDGDHSNGVPAKENSFLGARTDPDGMDEDSTGSEEGTSGSHSESNGNSNSRPSCSRSSDSGSDSMSSPDSVARGEDHARAVATSSTSDLQRPSTSTSIPDPNLESPCCSGSSSMSK